MRMSKLAVRSLVTRRPLVFSSGQGNRLRHRRFLLQRGYVTQLDNVIAEYWSTPRSVILVQNNQVSAYSFKAPLSPSSVRSRLELAGLTPRNCVIGSVGIRQIPQPNEYFSARWQRRLRTQRQASPGSNAVLDDICEQSRGPHHDLTYLFSRCSLYLYGLPT